MPVSRPRHGNFGVAASAPGVEGSGVRRAVPRPRNRGGSHARQCVPGDRGDRCQRRVVGGGGSKCRPDRGHDLRVAEVVRQDVVIENGQVSGFRVRLAISFKYESGD